MVFASFTFHLNDISRIDLVPLSGNHMFFLIKCYQNAWPAWLALFMKCLNKTSQCTSSHFHKMYHQHLLPIKTGHFELFFSIRSLPFIKWGRQEHFVSAKDPHFIKVYSWGMVSGEKLPVIPTHPPSPANSIPCTSVPPKEARLRSVTSKRSGITSAWQTRNAEVRGQGHGLVGVPVETETKKQGCLVGWLVGRSVVLVCLFFTVAVGAFWGF